MSSCDHNPRDDIIMSDDVEDPDFGFGSHIMNSNQPAVDYGDVPLVHDTPRHPPPLPEPPPSISDNINTGYEYSVTSADGEKLLFRLMYRVPAHDDDDDTITEDRINLIVVPYQDVHFDDDTIAIMQLVLYQAKYKTIRICRLASQVNGLYRVGKILSSIVLLLLQPGSVQVALNQDAHDDDDTIAIMQLVVLYHDIHDDNDTITTMQLVVALYQVVHFDDDTIGIMQLVVLYHDNDDMNTIKDSITSSKEDKNDPRKDTDMIKDMDTIKDPISPKEDRNDSINDSRKNGETKPVDSICPTDNGNKSIGNVIVTKNLIDGYLDSNTTTTDMYTIKDTAPDTATTDTATIVTATTTTTTTVRRPLSSTVPGLASGYSTTTIDGERILLCRLAYRVKRLYRVGMKLILLCRLAYRVNIL
jgi:hypothetical protein